MTTIPGLLAHAVAEHGSQRAVGDTYTYAQLDEAARAFGAALIANGIEVGDRVAIWAPNSPEWIVAFLGLELAGATLVPVNTRFKGAEAGDILRRARVRALITVDEFLGADYLGMLADESLPDLALRITDIHTLTGADRDELDARAAKVSDDDVSDILFTSGTTGYPKGVVQTQARTCRIATDWVEMTGLTAEDTYLMVNPYFHMFGLKAGILACIAAGATMLPEPVFDATRALERVASERVTVLPGAPTIYQALLDHPDRGDYDLSSLRVAVTGAADIPVELIRRVMDELPFRVVRTGYGLTEGGTATSTREGDDAETIATTVGRARPSFEMKIVDSEVLLKGATVMSHYLDDPDATAAAFTDDGWLKTGDLGALDDNGNLRIIGRAKDMFIVGGFNAYPAEIENLLRAHPSVAQVAVIGIPDDRLGEVGMAFVVAEPGTSPTEEEIVAWARETMANYKAPRRVAFVDALPLNATGKVEKNKLRELA
jgi:acyl-CoA synthetase (AMP-forming)/AMP-acid ligase II